MPGDVPYSCMRNALHYKYNATILKDEIFTWEIPTHVKLSISFLLFLLYGNQKTSLINEIENVTCYSHQNENGICKHNWVKIYETEKINYSVQTIKICWRLGIMQWGENESYYTYFIKLFTRTLSYRKRKKLGRIMGLGTPQNIYYQMPHINMHSYFTMKPISLFGNIQELQINFFLNTYHFHFCSIE